MPFCILLLSFQYQELYARKPKEGEEDPVLVEEIRKARENVGMYTRKTSIEYDETTPIRFNHHKSQLIMLLQQVRESLLSASHRDMYLSDIHSQGFLTPAF